MTPDNRILIAQFLGLVAVICARFGIEIDAQAQADILAGLSAFGLLLTAALAKAKKPSPPANGQSGFARPLLLGLLGGIVALALVAGCAGAPPRNTIAATSEVLLDIGVQVDQLQREGRISNEREDELIDRLKGINAELRLAERLAGDAQTLALQDINSRLLVLRTELAREEKRR